MGTQIQSLFHLHRPEEGLCSVPREAMWLALGKLGVPGEVV